MSIRPGRILVPAVVTLAILAMALFVFSFFGGQELAVGNLVLRAQRGTTYPLRAPQVSFPDAKRFAPTDTGSLAIVDGDYEEGRATVRWATGDHSSQWLPLFAFGPGAERFTGVLDNTEVGQLMAEALGLEPFPQLADFVEN